jgi:cytochrome P450
MTPHETAQLGPLPPFLQTGEEAIAPIVAPTGDHVWLVRDYALGRTVLADRRFSRAEALKPHVPKVTDTQPAPDSMMSMDGTDHARLRRLVVGAFSTGRIAALAKHVERLADEQLDKIAAAGPPADLMTGLATPLSLAVLCELLGIPAEDGVKFKDWVEVLFDISASSPEQKSRRRLALVEYMADLVECKRQRHDEDLITTLIGLHDQGSISQAEMLTLGLTLLMAGYETTVGQIGLTVLSLLSDPDTHRKLTGQPELLPSAVEELLRLNPSTPLSFTRVAVEPVRLGGVTLGTGETVIVSLLHGNRDAKVFPEPARFLPAQREPAHLTFGHGTHRCLGAPLARLQVQVVLGRLLTRFPALRLADGADSVAWKDGLGTRGLSRLLVAW